MLNSRPESWDWDNSIKKIKKLEALFLTYSMLKAKTKKK
jgi:hypothetical protein